MQCLFMAIRNGMLHRKSRYIKTYLVYKSKPNLKKNKWSVDRKKLPDYLKHYAGPEEQIIFLSKCIVN